MVAIVNVDLTTLSLETSVEGEEVEKEEGGGRWRRRRRHRIVHINISSLFSCHDIKQ